MRDRHPDAELVPVRRGDVALTVDRRKGAWPHCLLDPSLGRVSAEAVSVTSVDRDTFRGRLRVGGAKICERRDVVAVRSTVEEVEELFGRLVAIGAAARTDIQGHRERVAADALLLIDEAIAGQVAA